MPGDLIDREAAIIAACEAVSCREDIRAIGKALRALPAVTDLTHESETEVLQAVLDYVEAKSRIAFALSTEELVTECRLANEAAAKILPAGRRLAVFRAKTQRAKEDAPHA